ncbi:MAG: hypothetical protein EHM41_24485 [Chloroflexi bacterium]|nr:MAG: hypothetical protein EHM41_24485 [Chloroflexota bacterium]
MSEKQPDTITHHAMLVAWGQFAQNIGLIGAIETVVLHQKKVEHSPQTKVLEFFVAILAGLQHLQELSRSAHPIDQDQAVAKAWLQTGWADYSGVSRTLSGISQPEADQIAKVLQQITQPILAEEVMQALKRGGRLVYDGDLTDRPVSNTSTSYPGVAYGHMGDGLHLGYQAAMVSLHSPTYGRFWLSVVDHPGDMVSCTQAEALVQAAETRTGLRPLRRTDLLNDRIRALEAETRQLQDEIAVRQKALADSQVQRAEIESQLAQQQEILTQSEADYQAKNRPERPYSALAKARQKLVMWQGRLERCEKKAIQQEKQLQAHQQQEVIAHMRIARLQQRFQAFETDNQSNVFPIQAVFRIDAGFGTRENVAWLIEMGYEVYTKPYSDWLTPRLKLETHSQTNWIRVGSNAEMIAWKHRTFADFPYPLDVGLERFYTGKTQRFGTLIHFGQDPVSTDLPTWFHRYNARQVIEAGIKEGKNVFAMHHLKVRSAPAILLQEQFAVFAANFVRWAARWLREQCPQLPDSWLNSAYPGVKKQVLVAAHTSAWVIWQEQGCLLRFTDQSLFAGRSLSIQKQWAVQLILPFAQNAVF